MVCSRLSVPLRKLFNPPSRSNSPVRSRSPSPSVAQWPSDDEDFEYDSDAERRRAIDQHLADSAGPTHDSIGMGPGRTGVKGVLRDHAEAAALARKQRAEEISALNRAMEKASLGGKTWGEEERERLLQAGKVSSLIDGAATHRGRFGHLMEVGVRSFVQAVEEDRSVWVVVHIYDSSLDRCAALDDKLSSLARVYPSVKFLHVRAGALGFASLKKSTPSTSGYPSRFPTTHDDDGDDPYGNESDEDDKGEDAGWEDDDVDTDVLPTMLVYRGGILEHNWVRVDWEAQTGIEHLLKRHDILRESEAKKVSTFAYDLSADDDDLDDGELVFGGSDDEV
ncbi:uncharacterized protein FIBRA_04820 [Fibroporia radiculosa]|uniref:Phosducin domain-containing protein n=1 Tax=Fibroporia radiculosa TaxID=599839 RepID=J4H361_9APHY|nr:uncharacterized protein FIBRA_04820 [Fibroporia radiculosa]CCM02714.1 predicted protein [Fibroporia radiculosa]